MGKYRQLAKKSLGQNFMIDENLLKEIADEVRDTSDVIVEIGGGLGDLTKQLAVINKVICYEIDDRLAPLLKIIDNVEVKNSNFLDEDISKLPEEYVVVANIPYNITSPILHKLLNESNNKPNKIVLVMQDEVAKRISAKDGDHSYISIMVQYYSETRYIKKILPESFDPKPKVNSALIEIIPNNNKINPDFFTIVKAGFTNRRKKLINSLMASGAINLDKEELILKLESINISPNTRPQELSLTDWTNLNSLNLI